MKRFSVLLAAALALIAAPLYAQSSADAVQGPTASGATAIGNPVPAGCVYQTSAPTLSNNQRTEIQCDASGNVKTVGSSGTGASSSQVQGPSASGATAVGNPVPAGCTYTAAGITLTTGQRGELQCDTGGRGYVAIASGNGTAGIQSASSYNGGAGLTEVGLNVNSTLFGYDGANKRAILTSATGNPLVAGNVASGVTDAGNPIKVGGIASGVSLPTAVTAGQRVNATFGLNGGQMIQQPDATSTAVSYDFTCIPDMSGTCRPLATLGFNSRLDGTAGPTIGDVNGTVVEFGLTSTIWRYTSGTSPILSNTTTAVTIKAAAGASIRNAIDGCQISSTALGASVPFAIRDGAGGTVMWASRPPTAGWTTPFVVNFQPPLLGTANTLVEVVTTTADTSGTFDVNCQGHTVQ